MANNYIKIVHYGGGRDYVFFDGSTMEGVRAAVTAARAKVTSPRDRLVAWKGDSTGALLGSIDGLIGIADAD